MVGVNIILHSTAQIHSPLPDSCSYWEYHVYDDFGAFEYEQSYVIDPSTDTVINSNVYHPINYTWYLGTGYLGAVREQALKLYFLLPDSLTEYIIADFSGSIGDTIRNVYTYIADWREGQGAKVLYDCYITDTDSVLSESGHYMLHSVYSVFRTYLLQEPGQTWDTITWPNTGYWLEKGGSLLSNYTSYLISNNDWFAPISGGGAGLAYRCTSDSLVATPGNYSYCASCQSTLDIAEYSLSAIEVYPNPSSGVFWVEIPKQVRNDGDIEVRVLDVLGKTVREFQVSSFESQVEVDLSGKPSGVYFVTVATDVGQYGAKVVVE